MRKAVGRDMYPTFSKNKSVLLTSVLKNIYANILCGKYGRYGHHKSSYRSNNGHQGGIMEAIVEYIPDWSKKCTRKGSCKHGNALKTQ